MLRRQLLSLVPSLAFLAACKRPGGEGANASASPPLPPELASDVHPDMPAPSTADAVAVSNSTNRFAFDLFHVASKPGQNLAFSPYSIAIALSMVLKGAKGATAGEIAKVLHAEGGDAAVTRAAAVANALESNEAAFQLRTANRLFGEASAKLEPAFVDDMRKEFGAPLVALDFRGHAENGRRVINAWVEKKTEQRIRDLIPAGALDASTRLVLVNAIYFLADWARTFEKDDTSKRPFHTTASTSNDVPTMHAVGRYAYAEKDGTKLVELPYQGDRISMVVVLPEAIDGLAGLEDKLGADGLKELRDSTKEVLVDLALPKFEIDPADAMPLETVLGELGMKLAFDADRADLGGMSSERLALTKVLHKAFVKVDEKGTEAAAATAIIAATSASPRVEPPPDIAEFHADHPFLFFIVDRGSGLILFMGKVADPAGQ